MPPGQLRACMAFVAFVLVLDSHLGAPVAHPAVCHTAVQMTLRYVHRTGQHKRYAAEKLMTTRACSGSQKKQVHRDLQNPP
jgi:hypothetical protein